MIFALHRACCHAGCTIGQGPAHSRHAGHHGGDPVLQRCHILTVLPGGCIAALDCIFKHPAAPSYIQGASQAMGSTAVHLERAQRRNVERNFAQASRFLSNRALSQRAMGAHARLHSICKSLAAPYGGKGRMYIEYMFYIARAVGLQSPFDKSENFGYNLNISDTVKNSYSERKCMFFMFIQGQRLQIFDVSCDVLVLELRFCIIWLVLDVHVITISRAGLIL